MKKSIFVSTFPPRKCGIATFTANLVEHIERAGEWKCAVIAIENKEEPCIYASRVVFSIDQFEKEKYREAAVYVNKSDVDLVVVEHEFGIFGGNCGGYICDFIDYLNVSFILTCHTVLKHPTFLQRRILQDLCAKALGIVVMTENSRKVLNEIYDVNMDKIEVIPHGIPHFRIRSPEEVERLKIKYRIDDKKIVSTFGFVNPNKGLEYGIKAIALVREKLPDVLYLILGRTHPMAKNQGELYKEKLEKLVESLDLEENVRFVDHFLTLSELSEYFAITQVYLAPYVSKEQAVSGALAYALGAGKAIVSTPFPYATEVLDRNRGVLVPFKDVKAMADSVYEILMDDKKRHELEIRARYHARYMEWSAVGKKYSKYMSEIINLTNASELGFATKTTEIEYNEEK